MVTRWVYGIADDAGRIRYVGKTAQQSIESRFKQHLSAAARDDPRTRHLPLHRWLKKHVGEAHVIELESGEWSVAELNAREVAWIVQYGLENLLNVARGGNGGLIPGNACSKLVRITTPAHREALRNAALNRWADIRAGRRPAPYVDPALRGERQKRAIITRRGG